MLPSIASNLSTALSFGFGRNIYLQLGQPHKSVNSLTRQTRFLCRRSGFCCLSPISTKKVWNTENFLRVRNNLFSRKLMAASGSQTASGDIIVDNLLSSCGNVSSFAKPLGVHFKDRVGSRIFQNASMSLKGREPYKNCQLFRGYFIFDVTSRLCSSSPVVSPSLKNYQAAPAPCNSDGSLPDMTLNGLLCDEKLSTSTISADENVGDGKLKLHSGSCYLPHPDKEETGGEDAHFICVNEEVIGVADGVGGWAEVGVNAGLYARELMSNSVSAVLNEPKGCIDPARVLDKAHSVTKAKGSSTACIICLSDEGIHAINLGDSGFIIVRDGRTVFQSPVQQHGFNFTYQLERGSGGDQPSSGQVFMIPVVPGDVIVAGTDGLFDNLYNNEVTSVVVHGLHEGLNPEAVAKKIAAFARQRALDRNRQTPFSTAAQEAGFRYFGGKLDDVTVIVSYIRNSIN